ncbi:hypothetical protein [Helicobacter sp. 23-1046]
MIQSHANALEKFSERLKKPKVIAISDIANYTGEAIDIQSLIAKLKLALSQNHKITFSSAVGGSGASIDTMIKQSRKLRDNAEFDPYTTKEKGELLAPDYSLSGKITKIAGGYEFLLTLSDLGRGVEVWSNIARFHTIPKMTKKTMSKEEEALQDCLQNGIEDSVCKELIKTIMALYKDDKDFDDLWKESLDKCFKESNANACKEGKELAKTFIKFFELSEEVAKEYPSLANKEDSPFGIFNQCEKDTECASSMSMLYALAERDKEAIALAKKAKNSTEIFHNIGRLLYEIIGEDYDRVILYFKLACNGRNSSCVNLAFIYNEKQDYFNANKINNTLCQKATNGIIKSSGCFGIGLAYHKGEGARQDFIKAMESYKKACNLKHAGACNNIGHLYDAGLGVRQNYPLAKQYYGKACDLGLQLGCDNYKLQ